MPPPHDLCINTYKYFMQRLDKHQRTRSYTKNAIDGDWKLLLLCLELIVITDEKPWIKRHHALQCEDLDIIIISIHKSIQT